MGLEEEIINKVFIFQLITIFFSCPFSLEGSPGSQIVAKQCDQKLLFVKT